MEEEKVKYLGAEKNAALPLPPAMAGRARSGRGLQAAAPGKRGAALPGDSPRRRLAIQPPHLPVRHLVSPRVNTGLQAAAAAAPYGVLSGIPRASLDDVPIHSVSTYSALPNLPAPGLSRRIRYHLLALCPLQEEGQEPRNARGLFRLEKGPRESPDESSSVDFSPFWTSNPLELVISRQPANQNSSIFLSSISTGSPSLGRNPRYSLALHTLSHWPAPTPSSCYSAGVLWIPQHNWITQGRLLLTHDFLGEGPRPGHPGEQACFRCQIPAIYPCFTCRCSSHNLGKRNGGTVICTLSEGNKGCLSPSLFIGPNQLQRGNMWGCSQSNGWAIYCYNNSFFNGMKSFMKFRVASAISVLSFFLQPTLSQLGACVVCTSCCCCCWGAQHRGASSTKCSPLG
ncbi:uncharacterized protein LOC111825453 [Myotis lucifugus]|uniref:uncharacterized protein LOC111825453 n=1 Tax=Myotis lucifugus TaxID=59463 RepID=UPI000CCC5ADD|nr:uncharacterized protein LOC111825453 [Myotis lucifugus]